MRFFGNATDRLRCLYATALFTGARPTELVPSKHAAHRALRKSEVDLENDTVLVRTAKEHLGEARRPGLLKIREDLSELLAEQMAGAEHVMVKDDNEA